MIAFFEDVIIQTVCRILTPFIQLYGLYVIAHGHHSPGGGFQGGVILGASFILLCLAYDIKEVKKRMSEQWNLLFCSMGVIIYSGIGRSEEHTSELQSLAYLVCRLLLEK